MTQIWHVRLFNGPLLLDAFGNEVRRFRSHQAAALLAYLALHLDQPCPREVLYDALWPEEEPAAVANRFRVTLSSLRRQLEPEGPSFGTVLDASEPGRVRLRAETVGCDLVEFDRLWKAGQKEEATRLASGTFLPGFYEEWVLAERTRVELLLETLGFEQDADPVGASASQLQERAHPVETPPSLSHPERAYPSAPVSSLPLYLTRFFGRETEQQTLLDLLETNRVVCVVGMGGFGKTRLVTETLKVRGGPHLFLSLAALPDPERLYDTALLALGIAPQTDSPTDEQLIHALKPYGPILLVLDNAEHLIAAVAMMALRLLEQLPDLRLLVTSRQRLDIPGEVVLQLCSLESPNVAAQPERLLEFSSVSLFVDRARNARPDFVFSARHAEAVVEICKRIEGIPLALELAAARITAQTPQQIAESLLTQLTHLKSRQRGLSQRHQSLRAVVQGSLDLLLEEQRTLFFALSVFQGGWTVEAAAAVTPCSDVEESLHHLIGCSLVVAHEEERLGIMRCSLLETLRQFAAESLTEQEQNDYRERHARFFIAMVRNADYEDVSMMDRLEADHENLLLAMYWCWRHDRDELLPLLPDVLNLWANRGYHRLALEWLALAPPDLADSTPTLASLETGRLIGFRIYVDVGRYEDAKRVALTALDRARDPVSIGNALTALGYVCMMNGDWDRAIEYHRKALSVLEAHAEDRGSSALRLGYALMAAALLDRADYGSDNPDAFQDYVEAERILRQGLVTLQPSNRLLSGQHAGLFRSLSGQQRFEEADACLAISLQLAHSNRHLTGLARSMMLCSFRMAAKGFLEASVRLAAAGENLRERMGYRLAPYHESHIRQHVQRLRQMLGDEAFDRQWQEGWHTPLEALVATLIPQIVTV